jgi:hypothetical protein
MIKNLYYDLPNNIILKIENTKLNLERIEQVKLIKKFNNVIKHLNLTYKGTLYGSRCLSGRLMHLIDDKAGYIQTYKINN